MFICQFAGEQVEANTPVNWVVTETRVKKYRNLMTRGPNRGEYRESTGSEIVEEIAVCPTCFRHVTGQEPQNKTELKVKKVALAPYKGFSEEVVSYRPTNRRQDLARERSQKKGPVVETVKPL